MRAKRSRQTRRQAQSEGFRLKIILTVSDATPFFYCNHAAVSHTRYDFVLTLARIPTTLTPEQRALAESDKVLSLEASLQVAISPQLIPGVIRALTDQRKKYEERFGPIQAGDEDDHQA